MVRLLGSTPGPDGTPCPRCTPLLALLEARRMLSSCPPPVPDIAPRSYTIKKFVNLVVGAICTENLGIASLPQPLQDCIFISLNIAYCVVVVVYHVTIVASGH